MQMPAQDSSRGARATKGGPILRKLLRPVRLVRQHFEKLHREEEVRIARFEKWLKKRKSSGAHAPALFMTAVAQHVRTQASADMKIDARTSIQTLHEEVLYSDFWVLEGLERSLQFETDYALISARGIDTIEDLAWLIYYIKEGPEAKGEI